MSLGISHGSLDNLKGKKLLKIFKIKTDRKILYCLYMFSNFYNFIVDFITKFFTYDFSFNCKLPFWQRGYGFQIKHR